MCSPRVSDFCNPRATPGSLQDHFSPNSYKPTLSKMTLPRRSGLGGDLVSGDTLPVPSGCGHCGHHHHYSTGGGWPLQADREAQG